MRFFLFFTLLSFLCVPVAHAQESNSWLYVATAPPYSVLRPNDVIETGKNNILIACWDYEKTSQIIKLSEDGVLMCGTSVSAPDTAVIVTRLFANDDNGVNGFISIGLCSPDSGCDEALLIMHFDEDCNLQKRKVVPCVGLQHPILNLCVLKQRGGFIIAISESDFRTHHLAKLDAEGSLLKWETLEEDSLISVCNLFETLAPDDCFGLYANINNNSQSAMGVLVFDDSLQFVERSLFPQWSSEEVNGNVCYSYLYDRFNSMMMPSPDRLGYVVSSRLKEFVYSPVINDQSSIIAKTDSFFTMQDHYEVIGHLNDTVEYPAFYKSMDYLFTSSAPNYIYQCSMQGNCLSEPGWPFCQTPLCVIVTKTDSDLNIVWKKRFLMNEVYSPFAVIASSDGGCVVVGMVYDFNLERRADLFALKINREGTVGLGEIQEENMAYVYPNPARETVRIGGVVAKETQIYNALGQCVKTFRGNECGIEELSSGLYFFRVRDEKNKLQTLRVIVN